MKKIKLPDKIKGRLKKKSEGPIIPNSSVPHITNDTVAEHREQILSKARRYIYPLQHSKHRVVIISISLFILSIVTFFTYVTLALYRFQSNSTFLYRVTQVVPFPVARTGGQFVAYENYLFELRHYMHYYENQQELDFSTEAGQTQLAEYKKRALDKVINDTYIKQLASEHDITITDEELESRLEVVRNQNRLGQNDEVFEDVLKDFWDWSVDDFKRSLRQQMLAQKVVANLDTETQEKAKSALAEIQSGAEFSAIAVKYSDDPATKNEGGEFPFMIARSNPDLAARTVEALFSLEAGQTSGIVNIGYALQIVKTIEKSEDRVRGAHILFNFKPIDDYLNDLKEKQPARTYVSLPDSPESIEDPNAPAESADSNVPPQN